MLHDLHGYTWIVKSMVYGGKIQTPLILCIFFYSCKKWIYKFLTLYLADFRELWDAAFKKKFHL